MLQQNNNNNNKKIWRVVFRHVSGRSSKATLLSCVINDSSTVLF